MAIPQTRHAFPARLAQPGVGLFIERSLGSLSWVYSKTRKAKRPTISGGAAPPFLVGRFVYKESTMTYFGSDITSMKLW